MTGVVNFTAFQGKDGIAPVATAIDNMGTILPGGTIQAAYPWLNKAIILAILAGYSSVILVMLMGQSRVFYSMSRDGLLPKTFSRVHSKYRTPYRSNLLFLLLVSIFALFVPARVAGELTSIGTLLAFVIVCVGIIYMRKKMPDIKREFKTPLVPLIPILGIVTCLFMMVFLPFDTWIRLILWLLAGHDIYVFYGSKRSHLNKTEISGHSSKKDSRILSFAGLGIALILSVFIIAHQSLDGWQDITASVILLSISGLHVVLYAMRLIRN
jgi:APA family basic amino acid/polyamine antiporter